MFITDEKKKYPDDFIYITNLGSGTFGEVILVKDKSDMKIYVLKIFKNLNGGEIKAIF